MFWRRSLPTVTFATSCWEKDWRLILLDDDYLRNRQIANQDFPFADRLLIINNVNDLETVKRAAQAKVDEGVLSRYVIAEELVSEMFPFFELRRSDFVAVEDAFKVNSDWIYYNALSPLAAIYCCNTDYLLYLTGDVRLDEKISWIHKALRKMEKNSNIKVANLTWNKKYKEAKKESYKKSWNFFMAKEGFSDQFFLVKRAFFKQPIYGEIRADSIHFPRGDVFEKRVFSYMLNHGWERITFRHGSYTHENL
jgi:hypothetical protein